MRKPLAVANEILDAAKGTDDPYLTPMQLIKLVYLAHAWMLGLNGRPLLKESVEAWKYGPVVRSIYNCVKSYKNQPIIEPLKGFSGKVTDDFDGVEKDLIQQVVNIYGKWDGVALSKLTHMPGTPWDVTYREYGQNSVISNDLIENYYKRLYKERTEKNQTTQQA